MKVFVADNSAMLRKQLICLLSELHEIEFVGQAQVALEALHAVRELKPDVVILDIQISGGIDMLKTIKRADPAPVVIILTNSVSPPYRKSSIEAGADYFLDKSTESKQVREIIESLLKRFSSAVAEAV